MEGRVSQEEVATGRHVFITLVTDTIPPPTHFAPYLLVLRAISALICVTFRECAPTKVLPVQANPYFNEEDECCRRHWM